MKKTKLFALALAALTLGACSSSDDAVIAEGGATQTTPIAVKGYIGVNINMPSEKGARANDVFDDGIAAEYNVKNVHLVVFKKTEGQSEYAAQYVNVFNLTKKSWSTDLDNKEITAQFQSVGEVSLQKEEGAQYFGLIVMNATDIITSSGNEWKLNGTELNAQTTFDYFVTTAQELSLEKYADVTDGGNFLMCNAPMSSAKGGSTSVAPTATNIATLVEIDLDKIKHTESEALSSPAATFFVERAVAKVTVKKNESVTPTSPMTSADFKGWTLNQTNKKTFLVHNVKEAGWWGYTNNNYYRFVGGTDNDGAGQYRTYWGIDPNYSSNVVDGDFTKVSNTAPVGESLTGMGEDKYCFENTFDVDHMKNDQSTYAVVAIDVCNGNPFFVVDGNKNDIYDGSTLKTRIAENIFASEAVQAIKGQATPELTSANITITFEGDESTSDAERKVTAVGVTGVTWSGNVPAVFTSGQTDNEDIISLANNSTYAYYAGGVAYYPVLIRHFNNTETPWDETTAKTWNTPYSSGNPANDFLGRYGVLRNNWYELTVKSVKTIGEPVIPTPGDTWDDPTNSYLAVDIKILSWAKRGQDVEF